MSYFIEINCSTIIYKHFFINKKKLKIKMVGKYNNYEKPNDLLTRFKLN